MKRSRFTDSQIIAVLKQAVAGMSVPELCNKLGQNGQNPLHARGSGSDPLRVGGHESHPTPKMSPPPFSFKQIN